MSECKEKILLKIIFPLAEKLVGTCATKWLKRIQQMNSWKREDIEQWQIERLRAFINHAYSHTIYYRNLFDSLNLKPDNINSIEDLRILPTVNKNIIKEHFNEFIPDNLSEFKYRKSKTGGTTGEPMCYYCDEETWGYVTAAKIYYWKKNGYHYGDAFAALGSASLFPEKKNRVRIIYDKMRNEHGLNGMNMSDDICQEYVKYIIKHNIHFIYGYASSIFLFAKYIILHKSDDLDIKAVFSTSEKLTPEYRKCISDAFRCKVIDCYGAKDAGITAFEVDPGKYEVGYNVIAEVDGINSTLLTTNFLNYSFPLIRYEFGDEAVFGQSMDYNGQILLEIIGRSSDVIHLANGRNVTGPGFTILMKPYDVIAYDIRQTGPSEITLRMQVNPILFSQDQEKAIISKTKRMIGIETKLVIEYVEHFEPLKNGKRRYFMNC